jgi:hypothetical protein
MLARRLAFLRGKSMSEEKVSYSLFNISTHTCVVVNFNRPDPFNEQGQSQEARGNSP